MTKLGQNEPDLLFVYGSLMSGARGAIGARERRLLRWRARLIGRGTVPGRLYDLGGYPGWRPGRMSRPVIEGELWRLARGARLWPILDAYEGVDDEAPTYTRIVARVRRQDGRRVAAWIYEWTGLGGERPPLSLVRGRWRG